MSVLPNLRNTSLDSVLGKYVNCFAIKMKISPVGLRLSMLSDLEKRKGWKFAQVVPCILKKRSLTSFTHCCVSSNLQLLPDLMVSPFTYKSCFTLTKHLL